MSGRKFEYAYGLIAIVLGAIISASILVNLDNVSDGSTPLYSYRIANTYPHDPAAFTQGLVFEDGFLYEGTGLNGRSSLRKVDLASGKVVQMCNLSSEFFGEGITVYGDRIFQVTWQSHLGFVYDRGDFELLDTFEIATEGWGLTHDSSNLILSDGTSKLHFIDPDTYEETGAVEVHDGGTQVSNINELEYVDGEVFANIWLTDLITRIDPASGLVIGWLDLNGLLEQFDGNASVDVLNGIAYDREGGRLFVTGKLWPRLFEIELILEK
jgi:glutamine cyclotransferase